MILLENILVLQEPYIHLLIGEHVIFDKNIDTFTFNRYTEALFVTVIEGENCQDIDSLMKEFANKLKFPSYFGENWPAFDECINDLEWLESDKYILFIRNFDKVLVNDEDSFKVLLSIMKKAIKEWTSGRYYDSFPTPPTSFHLIMHCDLENEKRMDCRLSNLESNKIEKIMLVDKK